MSKTKQRIYLIIGPVLFVLCCLAIPKSAFPVLAERAAIVLLHGWHFGG